MPLCSFQTDYKSIAFRAWPVDVAWTNSLWLHLPEHTCLLKHGGLLSVEPKCLIRVPSPGETGVSWPLSLSTPLTWHPSPRYQPAGWTGSLTGAVLGSRGRKVESEILRHSWKTQISGQDVWGVRCLSAGVGGGGKGIPYLFSSSQPALAA